MKYKINTNYIWNKRLIALEMKSKAWNVHWPRQVKCHLSQERQSKFTQYIYIADPTLSVRVPTGKLHPLTLHILFMLVLANCNKHLLYTKHVSSSVNRWTSSSLRIFVIPGPVSSGCSWMSKSPSPSTSSLPNSSSSNVISSNSPMLFGLNYQRGNTLSEMK